MSTAKFRTSEEVDFVVIGSGAAGGVMTKGVSGLAGANPFDKWRSKLTWFRKLS